MRLAPDKAAAWVQLGHLLWCTGQLDNAEDGYRKALELHEALGDKADMASTYDNLGNVYQQRTGLHPAPGQAPWPRPAWQRGPKGYFAHGTRRADTGV
jgi:tetratricopeptide (TPR) repeat protein